MLSAVVITKNEENNIVGCLNSLKFAEQIVVLDNGSKDATVALARSQGAEVTIDESWEGFGTHRNKALALATHDWVIVIDADERVPSELADEVAKIIKDPRSLDAYFINVRTQFYGIRIRYGGFDPECGHIRLFRKSQFQFNQNLVHEVVETHGAPVGKLVNTITHHSYVDYDAYLRKVMLYSNLAATVMFNKGKRVGPLSATTHAIAAFLKVLIVKRGFLDGHGGWLLAVWHAEMTYHKYFRLWLMSRDAKQPNCSEAHRRLSGIAPVNSID